MDDYEDEFTKELKTLFPEMMEQCYDVYIGDGWKPIIKDMLSTINWFVKSNKTIRDRYLKDELLAGSAPPEMLFPQVVQIKEKFGELRVYCDDMNPYARGAITMAEKVAARTCEQCGEPGSHKANGWHRTLCDTHELEYQNRQKKLDEE